MARKIMIGIAITLAVFAAIPTVLHWIVQIHGH